MSQESGNDTKPVVDNKVIPVMREAVVTIQMILFKVLRQDVQDRCPDQAATYPAHLAGAVINNLFGTEPVDMAVTSFAAANRELVERELRELPNRFQPLLPILTDALRMKTICDNQEGIHSLSSLLMARALGILQEERSLPMPSIFILQVRLLAGEHGLIEPMQDTPLDAGLPG